MSHCHIRDDQIIVVKDANSSQVRISNQSRDELEICNIDGGLIADAARRCDKSVRRPGSWVAFVELKGRDVESAADQLFETFRHNGVKDKLEKKRAAIVVSKTVRLPKFDSFMARQKQKFARHHKALFRVERSGCTLCLESIFK